MGLNQAIVICDKSQTEELLPIKKLIDEIIKAAQDLQNGKINAPARQAVPFEHSGGTMLSMPATAQDLGIHKLVNVFPENKNHNLATINGIVAIYDSNNGLPKLVLDGPTVTIKRTAAVSMAGIGLLRPDGIKHAVIYGTGTQAQGHIKALMQIYPDIKIGVIGTSLKKSQNLIKYNQEPANLYACTEPEDNCDLIITTTTSKTPIYNQPAKADRLIVGVGAFRHDLAEIGPNTISGSKLFVDEITGAKHEAGDFIQAGVNWDQVQDLASLTNTAHKNQATIYKTVGSAAWDLAAARCAIQVLNTQQ